jgi:hypothetical protein
MSHVRFPSAGSALLGAALLCLSGVSAGAATVGPYFPVPNTFNMSTGSPRDALLKIEENWLENGIGNLKKARTETEAALEKAKAASAKPEEISALEEKIKKLDADIETTSKELELANDTSASQEVQTERKRQFLLAVNSWINELNHLATEQMKIAILKDGMEAQVAQNRNYTLSEQADALERAKHDITVEQWAVKR